MAARHVEGDATRGAHPTSARAPRRGVPRLAAALGAAALVLPLGACAGEEPSTDPPDPGAPITRSPS